MPITRIGPTEESIGYAAARSHNYLADRFDEAFPKAQYGMGVNGEQLGKLLIYSGRSGSECTFPVTRLGLETELSARPSIDTHWFLVITSYVTGN